jgi:predicted permease
VASTDPPYWLQFRLDGMALLCVGVSTALAAILAGVIPAVQAARAPVSDILKDESRGTSSFKLGRLSRALVIVEMALSVGLLAGAGLMIKSVIQVNTIDLGFPADRIFTARLALPETAYGERAQQQRFADDLLTRLESVQGARDIVLADGLPGTGGGGTSFVLEGTTPEEGEAPNAARAVVTPGYFALFDATPQSGRDFSQQDRAEAPGVAIVNAAFERRWFDGESALGRRLRLGGPDSEQPWLTIVGVVRDLRAGGTDPDARQEAIYLPMAQHPGRFMNVVARTDGAPLNLTAPVREAVTSLDRDVPLYFVNSLAAAIDENNWFYGVFGSLFAVFGLAALFLAGVGLYGVMSFSVGQRTRELGVRMAVGAQPADVIRMVLSQGMRQVLIGLAVGTVFALLVSRLLASILFEVSPRDPAVFATITTVLMIAAALACTLPALKATRVDPLDALRSE